VERLQSGRDAAEHGLLGNGAAAPAAQSGAAEQRRQAGASTGGGGGGGGSGEAEHAAEEVEQRSGALVEVDRTLNLGVLEGSRVVAPTNLQC